MEIKIENYLSDSEIKEIVQDELRNQIKYHFAGNEDHVNRILSNLCYAIVSEEVEKIVPNHKDMIVEKVAKLITEKDLSYHLYNFDTYGSGSAKSLGAKIIEQTVKENQQLIKDKVVESIQNADFTDEAFMKFENLAENFTHNIYDFVEMMRTKNSAKN